MPTNTVPNAADEPQQKPPVDERLYSCQFGWCTTDHFEFGWDQDADGNPSRFHNFEHPLDTTRVTPYLSLEETRRADGHVDLRGPIVHFGELTTSFSIEEGLEAIDIMLTTAGRWRDIAADIESVRS